MNIDPIGIFHSSKKNPYEAARQASADEFSSEGYVQLLTGKNFEQALLELDRFSHIWLLYQFHHNDHWKPMVLPPRGTDHKVGVFATRAPYRPNPIGLSAVELIRIQDLKIFIRGHDLLDQTPIIDIKPYLAYSDSIPQATTGWLQTQKYELQYSEKAQLQIEYLKQNGVNELPAFLKQQLEYEPTDSRRKRVIQIDSRNYEIAYRTWRAQFQIEEQTILVARLSSAYIDDDFQKHDIYGDFELHRRFQKQFSD